MNNIPMTDTRDPWIVPTSLFWRAVYGLATVLIPWLGFLLFANRKYGEAEWQDGQFSTYVDLTFSNEVWILFTPFLLYPSVAMLLLLIKPERFAHNWIVRWGIYSGTVLALQYTIQMVLTDFLVAYPLALFMIVAMGALWFGVCIIMPMIYLLLQHRIPFKWTVYAASALLFVVACIILLSPSSALGIIGGAVSLSLMGLVSTGLVLCAPIALLTTICLLRNRASWTNPPKWFPAALFSWLIGYGVAWFAAVQRVLELYEEMPTQPPNCYIATASAHGHPRLVRPLVAQAKMGPSIVISRQLQIMKAGELILFATAPNIHRLARTGYNSVGPWLARRINNRYAATLSYLLIKPFEWAIWLFLLGCLSQKLPTIYKFYTRGTTSLARAEPEK